MHILFLHILKYFRRKKYRITGILQNILRLTSFHILISLLFKARGVRDIRLVANTLRPFPFHKQTTIAEWHRIYSE